MNRKDLEDSAKLIKEVLRECVPIGNFCITESKICDFFVKSQDPQNPNFCELLESYIGKIKHCGINNKKEKK